MYESIDLIDVGKVTSVVLGLASFGSDPDGSSFPSREEFEDDDSVSDGPGFDLLNPADIRLL